MHNVVTASLSIDHSSCVDIIIFVVGTLVLKRGGILTAVVPITARMNTAYDVKRPGKVHRYKAATSATGGVADDPTPDYMNLLGMVFSMCGLMMKMKWCAWAAIYCAFVSFANSRSSEDTKQMLSSFMLSISAVVMSYLQNPQPMTPPW